ncbi:MAG: CRISPR-associated endonuclease Cas2 [Verrucomicrobiota bacterium]
MKRTLTGYRLMWMMIMFDLPVGTKKERKIASEFRNLLLDNGFEMSQFSVYLRFIGERERISSHTRWIEQNLPRNGKVSILFFTDRQFSESIFFQHTKREKIPNVPEQLVLI